MDLDDWAITGGSLETEEEDDEVEINGTVGSGGAAIALSRLSATEVAVTVEGVASVAVVVFVVVGGGVVGGVGGGEVVVVDATSAGCTELSALSIAAEAKVTEGSRE